MATYYGMVTTSGSKRYTPLALASFFQTSALGEGDRFFLIDNDGAYVNEALPHGKIELLTNGTPKSFAENVNQIMSRAREAQADLFFLNNDLVFTPGWQKPFSIGAPVILSPASNREIQYETSNFIFKNVISLEEFLSHQNEFHEALRIHHSRGLGFMEVLMLPFFCVKIPFSVYSVVGPLDEEYGRGGAEDNDYCVRAILAGFRIQYALSSFILHFNGRSTWGVETKEATDERCRLFTERFGKKWGDKLTRFSIKNELEILKTPQIQSLLAKRDFREVLRAIARLDGITV